MMNKLNTTVSMLGVAIVGLMMVGCAEKTYNSPVTLIEEPQPGPAASIRNFDQSVATWSSDNTKTGAAAFRYSAEEGHKSGEYAWRDPVVYVGNMVALPYVAIADRKKKAVSEGVVLAPSHSGNPAYPEQPAGTFQAPRPTSEALAEIPANEPAAGSIFAVVGHVSYPGRYQIKVEKVTLTQVLPIAGLVQKDPSKVTATIVRADGSTSVIQLDQATGESDPVIQPGDVVTVKVVP
jgi:hypothetical protein